MYWHDAHITSEALKWGVLGKSSQVALSYWQYVTPSGITEPSSQNLGKDDALTAGKQQFVSKRLSKPN